MWRFVSDVIEDEQYAHAVDNFIRSCAGYCVATYILGIGDRHNDNIMVNKRGFLFRKFLLCSEVLSRRHDQLSDIDFGHFLGNFKKWGLYKREKAPFVLTPEFVYVMGGKDSANFDRFVHLCCVGYNALRRNANVFINLFRMVYLELFAMDLLTLTLPQMLSTGIPELKSEEDVDYLATALSLDLPSEDEASKTFTRLIYESLNTKATQINFAIHLLARMIHDLRTSHIVFHVPGAQIKFFLLYHLPTCVLTWLQIQRTVKDDRDRSSNPGPLQLQATVSSFHLFLSCKQAGYAQPALRLSSLPCSPP